MGDVDQSARDTASLLPCQHQGTKIAAWRQHERIGFVCADCWQTVEDAQGEAARDPGPPKDVMVELHRILGAHGIASLSSRDQFATLPGALLKWAADMCRQTMELEAKRNAGDPGLRVPLEHLRDKWREKANEKRGTYHMHSERTIATLRSCADELDALLARATPRTSEEK